MHFTYSNFRLKDVVMKHYHHLTQEQRYSTSAEIKTSKTSGQEARSRIGDMEGDTTVGQHHKRAVLTVLERKSLYCWLMPMANRKAGITAAACVQALAAFKPLSITFDNGQEFT